MTRDAMIEKLRAAHMAATDALQRQWRGEAAFKIGIPARPGVDTDFLICDPIQEVIAALQTEAPPAPPEAMPAIEIGDIVATRVGLYRITNPDDGDYVTPEAIYRAPLWRRGSR